MTHAASHHKLMHGTHSTAQLRDAWPEGALVPHNLSVSAPLSGQMCAGLDAAHLDCQGLVKMTSLYVYTHTQVLTRTSWLRPALLRCKALSHYRVLRNAAHMCGPLHELGGPSAAALAAHRCHGLHALQAHIACRCPAPAAQPATCAAHLSMHRGPRPLSLAHTGVTDCMHSEA